MVKGGLLQLCAAGPDDVKFIGNPQITYFQSVYRRHTNFAIETIPDYFSGNVDFGDIVKCKLTSYGDLIKNMRLSITLPKLEGTGNTNYSGYPYIASWVNSIGHAIIRRMWVEIGDAVIDQQYGMWLEIWDELTLMEEKKDAHYNAIGKHDNFNVMSNNNGLVLEIPLPFWFSKNIALALPLIALYDQDVTVGIEFESFDKLWVSSTGEKPKIPKMEDAHLEIDYVFLETPERRRFVYQPREYLIEQIKYQSEGIDSSNEYNRIELEFDTIIKELVWVIQRNDVFDNAPNGGNETFNFSNKLSYQTTTLSPPYDIMTRANLQFEGNDRIEERDVDYFRRTQTIMAHSRAPNNHINVISFSLGPEDFQPKGQCNFEYIDNKVLIIKILNGIIKPNCYIFAPCYNFLRIEYGMASLFHI
jgi:hypothetical protein